MDLRELSVTTSGAVRHPWEQARANAIEYLLRKDETDNAAILDFGCGDAFVANRLAERFENSQVFAVDKAFTPAARLRIEPGLDKRVRLYDSLATVEAKGVRASWVLLLDVLEHCEQDLAVLKSVVASHSAKPGAVFLITVPAFQGLFSKHDEFLGHFRRYSLKDLARVAEDAGLTVTYRSYFFSSLLLPRGLTVVLERLGLLKSSPKGLGDYRPRPFFDSLIRAMLDADFRVCEWLARAGIYLPGLSCLVVARKPVRAV